MKPTLRDRQALKRLRKMEKSASLRLGEHLTTSVVKPWRFPFLPISFPLLVGKILLEKVGIIQEPETRVEWQKSEPGHGLLVFVDGYTKGHALNILQDLQDLKTLQPEFPVLVVCTSKFQTVFRNTDFPVFVLPNKDALLNEQKSDWGSLLEEQLGGIAGFFLPSMVIIVGPYPHRGIKNLLRSNPEIAIYLDQRPSKTIKKMKSSFYTHLTGVLRDSGDQNPAPKSTSLHKVRADALTSWIVSMNEGLSFNIDDSKLFLIEQSKDLVKITEEANRDTNIISKELERIAKEFGLEKLSSLVLHSLLVMEQKDQSYGQKYTRDLFVAAIRSYGKMNLDYMLELAHSKMGKFKDERAAKSIIQFIKNSDNPEEATVFLKYVKDKEWIKREVLTVTTKLLKMYGVDEELSRKADDLGQMNTPELQKMLLSELQKNDLAIFSKHLENIRSDKKKKMEFVSKILSISNELHNPEIHKLLKEHSIFENASKTYAKNLSYAFMLHGDYQSAIASLELCNADGVEDLRIKSRTIADKIEGTWINKIIEGIKPINLELISKKVVYLTHMSLPFESAGYCTRTHGLLTNLKQFNSNLRVQNRFGYPLDKGKLRHLTLEDVNSKVIIDGLEYGFDKTKDKGIGDPDEYGYISRAVDSLFAQVQIEKPELIQAASNHVNGAIGLKTARMAGLPFVYEVRGLWHMSRVARQPHFYHHSEYEAMDNAEISICKESDLVLAITHAVRHYLVSKGVDEEKILVLPNGVDTNRFTPLQKDENLRSEIGLTDGLTIGYVGSFVRYEGLELLVEAFCQVNKIHPNVNLLFVGDGETKPNLENMVKELGLEGNVFFTGRVPHSEVQNYHSLIDIAPFPRTPDIVCEFISPLKPFESMAMGQVVVASNVAALSEIIEDGVNGRLFKKGDHVSLSEVIIDLIENLEDIKYLSENGRNWVTENRDWQRLAKYLNSAHDYLLHHSEKPDLLGSGKALSIVNGRVTTQLSRKPNLMVIMDEFSTTALAPDANLVRPNPGNWPEILDDNEIDALIVESAWEGNIGSWRRKVGYYSEEEIYDLRKLVESCRKRNIPTIFYNKEDPVHFNRFSRTAMMFDHIFTTDEGCINKYLNLGSNDIKSVDWIRFAAQPSVHNPYNSLHNNRESIAFAGTYYSGKYIERCKKMDMLLDASVEHDLIIYDRQSDGGNPQYVFPERFSEYVRGKLDYEQMLETHRKHLMFLNVNSVEDSKTMAARRIFEIPAAGACLVSGPGLAVKEVYGNIVPIVTSQQESSHTISGLKNDPNFLAYTIQKSREVVLSKHLNSHRLAKMMNSAGINLPQRSNGDVVVCIENNSVCGVEILLWISRQYHQPASIILNRTKFSCAEKLLLTMLESRGINFLDDGDYPEKLVIYEPLLFDRNGIGYLMSELLASDNNLDITDVDGKTIAKIISNSSQKFERTEYLLSNETNVMKISTISEYDFNSIPKKLLIAGHDLKFAEPITSVIEEMGVEVLVDKWTNHNQFDESKSLLLLDQADAVWCEWALGNVEWFSNNLKEKKPLFVRYHLQERELDYLSNSDFGNISHISFVCDFYEKNAKQINQVPEEQITSIIPNQMKVNKQNQLKNDNFSIGFVGMIPKRKRLDLALDVIEELIKHDDRYVLKIVGKSPNDYSWLMKRDAEKNFYSEISDRLEANSDLAKSVKFLGFVDDIGEFYSSVGHVLSVSDFESYHLTLADGPANGAVAHTLNWDGADSIYTDLWLNESVEEIVQKIIKLNTQNKSSYYAYLQSLHLVDQMQPERVALSILQAICGGVNFE